MAEWTMRRRSSSRCSIRLIPGSSARSVTAFRALSIASPGSTIVGCLLRHRAVLIGCGVLLSGICLGGLGGRYAARARGGNLLARRRRLNPRIGGLGQGGRACLNLACFNLTILDLVYLDLV